MITELGKSFKAIFHDSRAFLRRERPYALLLVLVIVMFIFIKALTPIIQDEKPVHNEKVVQQLQTEQRELYFNLEKSGSWVKFLEDNPKLTQMMSAIVFMMAGIFTLGLIINFMFLTSSSWRRSLSNPKHRPKSKWEVSLLFKVILLFISGTFGISVVLGFVQTQVFGGDYKNLFLLLETTIADFYIIALVVIILRKNGGSSKDLGICRPKTSGGIKEVVMGLIGYVGVFPIFVFGLLFMTILAHVLAYEPPLHPLVSVFVEEESAGSKFVVFYSVLLGTVLGPILEEVFFRGFFYNVSRRFFRHYFAFFCTERTSKAIGMILTSLFFAWIHHNAFAFWPIFILGMGLVYVYEKRQSLIAPVVLHVFHNSIFIAYFFMVREAMSAFV